MSRYSKDKGHAFERKVAKMIREVFDVAEKDCFRTPLSGGHHLYQRGDLVMSPQLFRRFPYLVECKHSKSWSMTQILPISKMLDGWLRQAYQQATEEEGAMLLVAQGHHSPIYAFVEGEQGHKLPSGAVVLRWQNRIISLMRFDEFLVMKRMKP
jgi:hypothetical protein